MKITNEQVFGFEGAIRGMRNPMNSHSKSDSHVNTKMMLRIENSTIEDFYLGQADKKLSQKLTRAGAEHCKHLRLIQVWFDLDAPRYMWQEMDTYKHMEKVSCSTMHKIFERDLTVDDFEGGNLGVLKGVIEYLNALRQISLIIPAHNSKVLLDAKTILPESFLQLRTVNTNYQQLLNIYHQRKNHKLPVWREFCEWIEQLPYFVELTGIEL